MKYLSDLHTHSIVSGHAYSTFLENVEFCRKNGIKVLGTSEHGPTMPGAPHIWFFGNLRVLPRLIDDVIILRGCEANIMDIGGNIDIPDDIVSFLDYLIVSFHEPIFAPNTKENNTKALLNAINSHDNIEILGHLGNPSYPIDYELVVKTAKEKDILIEINNSSLRGITRVGSSENCSRIANLCKELGAKVILTSDAHICFDIANYSYAEALLDSINFPEDLIVNDPDKLISHFKNKGKLKEL